MPTQNAEFDAQYVALTRGVGLVDFSDRTQLELTGADRAKFLHNLCTNAVRELPPGKGCETFLLNVKGHIVGHVFLFVGKQSLVLETVPGQSGPLMAHLDRYLIREDVQLYDRSAEWAELLLAGVQAETLLTEHGLTVPQQRLEHTAGSIAGRDVWLRRVDLTGPIGFQLAFHRDALNEVAGFFVQAGAVRCGADVFDVCRIEHGTPLFGRDISDDNLPQEVNRDSLAISFTKGCYLGQETVARIDALGHVNRLLRGVKFSSTSVPTAGMELSSGKKMVGQVTSACWSPSLNSPLALAYVRRGHAEHGTKHESPIGAAEVIALPVAT
jgi:tRNA-modifying protein YgfZ